MQIKPKKQVAKNFFPLVAQELEVRPNSRIWPTRARFDRFSKSPHEPILIFWILNVVVVVVVVGQ